MLRPREAHSERGQLDAAHTGRARDRWLGRLLGEVAGDHRHDAWICVRDHRVRRWPARHRDALCEADAVKCCRSLRRAVPVDEDGAVVEEAQVVAAGVEVHEGIALKAGAGFGLEQGGERVVEPARRADAAPEDGRRVRRDGRPLAEHPVADLHEVVNAGGWFGGGNLVEHAEHTPDVVRSPRRRPVTMAQVFDHKDTVAAAVVAGEERRSAERVVGAPLGVEPAGGHLVHRRLHKDGRAVGEQSDPPQRRRVPARTR